MEANELASGRFSAQLSDRPARASMDYMMQIPFFLDFDGTLHPTWIFEEKADRVIAKAYEGPWCIEASTLERILSPHIERFEIIISSWWAYRHPLEQVRSMLTAGLAQHVTDSIWLPELMAGSNDYYSHLATRFNCIDVWLKRRRPGYSGPWLALDDEADSFPSDQHRHLVHACGTLANARVQAELASRLAEILSTHL